jgi:hypothetical protein
MRSASNLLDMIFNYIKPLSSKALRGLYCVELQEDK